MASNKWAAARQIRALVNWRRAFAEYRSASHLLYIARRFNARDAMPELERNVKAALTALWSAQIGAGR